MSNRFYSLRVPADWRSDKAIAVDITTRWGPPPSFVALGGERVFFPRSQCREQNSQVYVSQWIIERKRDELVERGLHKNAIDRGLSEVFDWEIWVDEDRPAKHQERVAVDVSPIREIFEKASENLKFPKIKIETCHGKVVFKKAGERSSQPGVIHVTDGGPFGSNAYYGRIDLEGKFHRGRDCGDFEASVVLGLANDPSGYAAAYGRETGNCCFCSRELTDSRSVSVGYGPVCADHFGLPWGHKEHEEVA